MSAEALCLDFRILGSAAGLIDGLARIVGIGMSIDLLAGLETNMWAAAMFASESIPVVASSEEAFNFG